MIFFFYCVSVKLIDNLGRINMFVVVGFPVQDDLFQSLQSPKEPCTISFLPSRDRKLGMGTESGFECGFLVMISIITDKRSIFFVKAFQNPSFFQLHSLLFCELFSARGRKAGHVLDVACQHFNSWKSSLDLRVARGHCRWIFQWNSEVSHLESAFPPLGIVTNCISASIFPPAQAGHGFWGGLGLRSGQNAVMGWAKSRQLTSVWVMGGGPCGEDGDKTEVFSGLCVSTRPVPPARAGFPNP